MQNITSLAPNCNHLSQDRPEVGAVAELPAGLCPQQFPILATHWFGAPPFVLDENGETEPVKSRRLG